MLEKREAITISSICISATPQPVSVPLLGAGGCQLRVAYAKPFQTWERHRDQQVSGKRGLWELIVFSDRWSEKLSRQCVVAFSGTRFSTGFLLCICFYLSRSVILVRVAVEVVVVRRGERGQRDLSC